MYSQIYNLKNISSFDIDDQHKMSNQLLNGILKAIFKDKQVLLIPSRDIQEYWLVKKEDENLQFKLGQFYNPKDSYIYEFENDLFNENYKDIGNYDIIKNQITSNDLVYFIYDYEEHKFKYELCSEYLIQSDDDIILQIIKFSKPNINDELIIEKIYNYDLDEVNLKIDIFYNNEMIFNIINRFFLNIVNNVNNNYEKETLNELKNVFKNAQYRKIGDNPTNIINTKLFNHLYNQLVMIGINDLSIENNYEELKSQVDVYDQLNYYSTMIHNSYIPQFFWFKDLITKQKSYTFSYEKYTKLNYLPYKISLNVTKSSNNPELTNIKFKRIYLYVGDYVQDKSYVDITKTGIQNLYFDMNIIKETTYFDFKVKVVDYEDNDITDKVFDLIDNYQIELNILFFQRDR